MKLWMAVPALGAAMVLAVFLLDLNRGDGDSLPSALLQKPVPEFALEPLYANGPGLAETDLTGPGVKLVNIWASWCVPCRAEHPHIKALAQDGVPVHGINYKDTDPEARAFLEELGNPYTNIGADRSGRAGIEWGVYGVPETFVIDGQGRIVYKHIGPILGNNIDRVRAAIDEASR